MKKLYKTPTNPQPRVRVGIYMRRSTDDEHQPYTLEAQKVSLNAYVLSQPEWNIVKSWTDSASGATINREGLQDALQAAKAGLIDVLLVYRVDRFSRSLRDTVTLLDELDAAGVAFRSATEPFDTSNPMGRILLQLLSMFAQFERDVLIDRVIAGMERKAAQGKWRGGQRPFGYLVDKATHFLIPNTSEEAVVRLIFNLYVNERIGTRAIATVLNDRGHRTAAGGIFSGHQVLRVLTNRVYLGEISFRDIVVEQCHPPLIESDTWDRVQRLVKCRSESHAYRAADGSDYIATGRLTCPKCGKPMIGTRATGRTNTYRYYTCWNRSRYGTTKCDAERINADALDAAVLDAIASFYQIQHVLTTEAVNAAREAYTSSHCTLAAELTTVQAEIRRTTSKIDKYLSAFEGGTLTSEDVSERLAALKTTGAQLSRRRGELLDKLASQPKLPDAATSREIAGHIRDVLETGNTNQRKALVESLVARIKIVGPGKIVPVFRVPHLQAAQDSQRTGDTMTC